MKPIASLSLDLDNKWAYLRAAGQTNWESVESYLPLVCERIVDMLGCFDLPLTTFVVGRDFQSDSDVDAMCELRSLSDCEFANHSLNHLPWMHTMSSAEIRGEIVETHQRISDSLHETALGFRGPGFSCPDQVLRILMELNYAYDASSFPTSVAPIARAVFLMRTRLRGEHRERAKKLYGGFASMRQPNVPHRRCLDGIGTELWELPVSVMPLTRTPIHFSYVTFLAGLSVPMAKAYFSTALSLCRSFRVPPSLLLHPPDFLGREDDADLAYFPGMKLSRKTKLEFMRWALRKLSVEFDVRTMIDQVRLQTSATIEDHAGSRSNITGLVDHA